MLKTDTPLAEAVAELIISELNVAGALIVAGHKLLRVQPGNRARGLSEFVFAADPTIERDRQHYFARALNVDARTICDALLNLKRQAIMITKEKSVFNEAGK